MAPGQYDTPLADFLDALPGYVNQFQQNQLALGRQQLADKRYDNSLRIQEDQRKFNNEKDIIGMLPSNFRSGVMKTSNIPKIRELGNQLSNQEDAIQGLINPKIEETIEYYRNLKNNKNILNNKTAQAQIDNKIEKIKRKNTIETIENFIEQNPNDPRIPFIKTTYKLEPESTLRSLIPYRQSLESKEVGGLTPPQLNELYDDLITQSKAYPKGSPEREDRMTRAGEILKYRESLTGIDSNITNDNPYGPPPPKIIEGF